MAAIVHAVHVRFTGRVIVRLAQRMSDSGDLSRHSILAPGNMLMVQERERRIAAILRRAGMTDLDRVHAIEAGCAGGYNLRMLVQWGAREENLVGVDIDEAAITYASGRTPAATFHARSAADIPEPDGRFDLAMAFTLFSSVPADDIAADIGREMIRVVRPGGLILVYDMRRGNPYNKAVHPVSRHDIKRWFPGLPVATRTMTLAPPLARVAGRWAPWSYGLLAAFPPARTHALHVLRKPRS